ncbi:hypothetical protein PRIPAC_93135 [Pristionchus pacificus]|uniref:C6 domain-containing protein n=1 Tax=Pristionchus pacificus TaxID=54126 RepID=A0A2A6BQ94_PRIPA|nr:hypothetical protein PRIPAC_93135 [Pristionchus pacificus]|eukprot:PDM68038.1 hypothetical protein PRIPAC_46082 [Pristionchus pacificus]
MRSLAQCALIAALLAVCSEACMRVNPVDPGMPACVGCKCCAQSLITYGDNQEFGQPMNSDVTDTTGACAVRTFTCISTNPANNANIAVNGGDGAPGGGELPGEAPNLDRVIMPVECNAAGTAWTYLGAPVTQVECTYNV